MSDLLDLLEEQETHQRLNGPCPSLFNSPTRGVQERVAEFTAWCTSYDSFASYRRSHAWLPEIGTDWCDYSTELPPRCLPTVLHADLQDCDHTGRRYCYEVGGLVYRGACYGCTWEGPIRGCCSEAVEDAHDHAWPGWRNLPTAPRPPSTDTAPRVHAKALAAWAEKVNATYPPGWLAGGGPIVTDRTPGQTRDVPGGSRHGGYDLATRETPAR